MVDDIPGLRRILATHKVIAIVGLSADWFRPSYFAAKYMLEHGYTVIPVNPRYDVILGQRCYKSLRDIPVKVDIVDCFRKTADIMPIADEAIAIGAKVLWQQLGVTNAEAAAKAGHPLRLRVQVKSFEAVCKLVQANMGIGVLPEAAAVDFAPVMGLRLIRLTDAWADRCMHVCVRDFDSLPANGRKLVEQLVGPAGLRNKRSPA